MIGITVALASHNGANTLPRVLDAYLGATPPACEWRLVIVDNASTDDTPALVNRYLGRLPLVFLREDRRGKNRALNTAIPSFAGPLIVLTDDDAIPERDFLVRWSEVAARHPDYTMFGGAIRPAWPEPPPDWLLASDIPLKAPYAVTEPDQPEGPIVPEGIFGPNMAVRSEVFAQGTTFDESIGPSGKSYAMGSETSLTLRLARAGHRGWFLPDIVVSHVIRGTQLSRAWLRRRASNLGRGIYHHDRIRYLGDGQPVLFGAPRWRLRQQLQRLVGTHAALLAAAVSRNPARIAGAEWRSRLVAGWFYEFLHNAR